MRWEVKLVALISNSEGCDLFALVFASQATGCPTLLVKVVGAGSIDLLKQGPAKVFSGNSFIHS